MNLMIPSNASVVSNDGTVIAGNQAGSIAWRWTAATGAESLGLPPNVGAEVTAMNGDGSMIAGRYTEASGQTKTFLWTTKTGLVDWVSYLAFLGISSPQIGSITSMSDDGRFIVANVVIRDFVITCDSIDFNRNMVFPEDQDVIDFFSVLAGGPCPYAPTAGLPCDIDFNNNQVFPEDQDVIDFFNVLAGGICQ